MSSHDGVDLSGFKKKIMCGGRQYDEFSNFYGCTFWALDDCWPSSEHYYQALKFPGASGEEMRETIRNAASPMESWQVGNSKKSLLRKDWEEVKVDMMWQSNFEKFSQSEHLRQLLIDSNGPIICDGGLFWKTWNEIVLERIREELRDDDQRSQTDLEIRIALMKAYSEAVVSGDERGLEAVTLWAAKRELPPKPCETDSVTVSGLVAGQKIALRLDPLQPEINSQPHWVTDGWHLYFGKKFERSAWVLDECCAANEATGHAFLPTSTDEVAPPYGSQQWQLWDDARNRHMDSELILSE